jgi:hypothetical protein
MTVDNRTLLSTEHEYRLSSGILFEVVTLPMQSVSGSSSTKAPFNMEKEHMLLKKVGV